MRRRPLGFASAPHHVMLQVLDHGFGKFQMSFLPLHESISCCDPRVATSALSMVRLRLCLACPGCLLATRGIELITKLLLESR